MGAQEGDVVAERRPGSRQVIRLSHLTLVG
jgi:hypothetical protein